MKKIKMMILFIVLGMLLTIPNSAHAGYQSKPGTALTLRPITTFFEGCRNMETSGGVLGLEEGLNEDYTGTTNGGNGIDAHMALNTEWGTIALFTNSKYGVKKGISGSNNDSTSTGNATGVYGLANGTPEYVATMFENSGTLAIKNFNSRYLNNYIAKERKAGDALECAKWLGTNEATWVKANRSVFERGISGLFGFESVDSGTYYRKTTVPVPLLFAGQGFKIKMFVLVDRFKIYPLFSFFLDIFILICYNIKS